jgi:hypothetical protein
LPRTWSLALAVVALTAFTASAQNISIQYQNGDFKVTCWTGPIVDPEGAFGVYVGTGNVPPLLGAYSAGKGTLIFHPRFPLAPGVHYRAVFQLPDQPKVETFFDGPPQDTTRSTRIDRVYPSAATLPANQLKLYLYFSAPMSRGEAWQHVRLLDEAGKVVPFAFLEIDQELWDSDNRRLTVLFDPGRLKRGLVPANELGAPLVEGRKYTLSIDNQWPDARGVGLAEGFEKVFSVGPADRVSPDPAKWVITAPKAGTSDALVVDFPEPMDYALLQRLITVPGVSGEITIGNEEKQWRFTPVSPWQAGHWALAVDSTLEDLAGNHLDRLFDVDLQAGGVEALSIQQQEQEANRSPAAVKSITLPFEVR